MNARASSAAAAAPAAGSPPPPPPTSTAFQKAARLGAKNRAVLTTIPVTGPWNGRSVAAYASRATAVEGWRVWGAPPSLGQAAHDAADEGGACASEPQRGLGRGGRAVQGGRIAAHRRQLRLRDGPLVVGAPRAAARPRRVTTPRRPARRVCERRGGQTTRRAWRGAPPSASFFFWCVGRGPGPVRPTRYALSHSGSEAAVGAWQGGAAHRLCCAR